MVGPLACFAGAPIEVEAKEKLILLSPVVMVQICQLKGEVRWTRRSSFGGEC